MYMCIKRGDATFETWRTSNSSLNELLWGTFKKKMITKYKIFYSLSILCFKYACKNVR